MSRNLTSHFLTALKAEFPFLADWEPHQLNSAHRPVVFSVSRVLDLNTRWKLEFGRYNNFPDNGYTNGVTAVAVSDGKSLEWHYLDEGETMPEDILKDDTRFVLVKHEYRNELVQSDPGGVRYTLYKNGDQTVARVKEDVGRAAQNMREQLEA